MTYPYTKQGPFVNNNPPAINDTRLNAIEQGIYDATLYGADAGGDDTYVLNLDTTLITGISLRIKVTTGNTGACTLSIDNGVTLKNIRKMSSSGLVDLVTGDIKAGQIVELSYDGTYWQLLTGNIAISAESAINATNATNATNADTLDGQHASAFMLGTKIYGNAAYTDSINATTTLTKTIALGASVYKHGIIVIRNSSFDVKGGIIAFFGTDNTKTLVTGNYATTAGSAWSRRYLTKVTSMVDTIGFAATGNAFIDINEIYINGSNLQIDFYNTDAGSRLLDCIIDWEVW